MPKVWYGSAWFSLSFLIWQIEIEWNALASDKRNVWSQFRRVLVFSRASDADFGIGPIRRDLNPMAASGVSPMRRARRFPTIRETLLSGRLNPAA
ncbi:hypothetical protein [Caballeronia zhejiangensis]|uniref:hypothetical protein n=1 Tax=Caballeronia zhejiangensis TaxID=871203 RepID=UPI001FD5E72E|nr:hypothetical protein [Caballeronia zhejiangensis]